MIIKTDVHVFIVGVHFIIVNECILIKRDIVFEKEKEEGGVLLQHKILYAVFIGKYLL